MAKKKKNKNKTRKNSNNSPSINKHNTVKDFNNNTNKEIKKTESVQELKKDDTEDNINSNISNNEENIHKTSINKDSETNTIDVEKENNTDLHQNEDPIETVEAEVDNTKHETDNKDTKQYNENNTNEIETKTSDKVDNKTNKEIKKTESVQELKKDDTEDNINSNISNNEENVHKTSINKDSETNTIDVKKENNTDLHQNEDPIETVEAEVDNTKHKTDNKDAKQYNKNNTNWIETLGILKDKRVITACAITALTSALLSIVGTNLVIKNKPIANNDITIENAEYTTSVIDIGSKLEDKKLINNNSMFTLDYTFDSRFEPFKDNILEIYTKVSNSDENFQEIFIIKNDDTNKVEECLNSYKENLINRYKNNNTFNTALSIAKDATIKSKNGITFFIASNNKADIEKVIINEINI